MKYAMSATAVLSVALAAAAATTVPTVSNVQMSQAAKRLVTITYDLAGAPGIVTVDILTNGVSIGGENLRGFVGDCSKITEPGTGRSITWRPDRFWPDGGYITNGTVTAHLKAYPTNSPPDYMVVDMIGTKTVRWYENEGCLPGGVTNLIYRTEQMVFRKIPAANATFRMGSPSTEEGRVDNEDAHYVTLTNDFYLGIFPVTQRQYRDVFLRDAWLSNTSWTNNPSSYQGEADSPYCPVDDVTTYPIRNLYPAHTGFDDVSMEQSWLQKFRIQTGVYVNIPTDCEWEFACRAGSSAPRNAEGDVDDIAWHSGNSGGRIHPVGLKKPNAWGLYDMLGNVWEICRDAYVQHLGTEAVTCPFFNTNGYGGYQVSRGGSFATDATRARSASRERHRTDHEWTQKSSIAGQGFRLWVRLP